MNLLKHIIIALLMTVSSLAVAQRGKFPDAVTNATRNADSRTLSQYFNDKVELVLPGNSGVFSKSQAEQIIKNFFASSPCDEFSIIHQGERDNSSFAIGKYKTRGKNLRFYFLVKEGGSSVTIHQLRIENQDE
ncbi:DUF4783 domain-containing protein [Breznakibacter xylanolyticus]|nr:DUF4783 domain-containing protein [Breznakibacter xylanolyticus]MBN2743342.1 DUF4783 domain-containing protein [Marinilabiliaceae bacterium]